MKRKWTLAMVLGLVGVAVYAGTVLATPQAGVATTTVAQGGFGELDINAVTKTADRERHEFKIKTKGLSDLYVIKNTFDPAGTTGWHTHPGPSLVIVTSGQITAYDGDDPTCSPTVYSAGQGFVDPGAGHVHMLVNKGTTPAETVAVQIIPRAAVRKIDAPAPAGCPSGTP